MRTNKRVGAIIRRENTLLLIHRFKEGEEYWVLPGGGVEDEETLEEALRREVNEETSLTLLKFEYLGTSNDGAKDHYYYECELSEGEPEIGGPEKEDSSDVNTYHLEWVEVKNIGSLNLYPVTVKEYL